MTNKIRHTRRGLRGQGGFSTMTGMVAIVGSLSVGGFILANGVDQVSAAETTVCEYDKSIVRTAVEAYYLVSDDLEYPVAAGPDGLDQVREADFLRSESKYWRYAGTDATGKPQFVLRAAVNGCD